MYGMIEEKDLFSLETLDDLPSELREELRVSKRDDFEMKLIGLFQRANGELNLDQIQAGYYRLYNEVKERKQITAKLYNMCRSQRPAIEGIKGKKGVYKIIDGFSE